MTDDRAAARRAEAAKLCGELGHWMTHRDRQDECPPIERALIEAEDAALERAAQYVEAHLPSFQSGLGVKDGPRWIMAEESNGGLVQKQYAAALRGLKAQR